MRQSSRSSHPRRLTRFLVQAGLLFANVTGALGADLTWSLVKKAIRLQYSTVTQISTDSLAAWLARADTTRPLLLDIRAPEEYQVSHLLNARLAPDLDRALELLTAAPTDTPIVAYCSVGYRSSKLIEQLQQAGYTRVFNLEGSIFAWANEGFPVYRDSVEVKEVHPYNDSWGRLLKRDRRARKK